MATSQAVTRLRCETCRLPWIINGAYTRQQARAFTCRYCGQALTWVKIVRRPRRARR
jgi:hypothetical protein